MTQLINIEMTGKPSALFTLWKAFQTRKTKLPPGEQVPELKIVRRNIPFDLKHLKTFYQICNISEVPATHLIYPFTLAYPYIMRLLCQKAMPFPMFRMLNTRNGIKMFKPIQTGNSYDIICYNSPARPVKKGIEMDVIAELHISGQLAWQNCTTYFCPGRFNLPGPATTIPSIETLKNAPVIDRWYLPATDRFRFARVSGDTNGIHYGTWYARRFRFERDFAQPLRVVARCIHALQQQKDMSAVFTSFSIELNFFLKGPVYYDRNLALYGAGANGNCRFDLYCEGNDRPCICGALRSPNK
ncbi:MAG: hypothetical protein SWH61_13870 [Thermodesulfobacteriota bacterium]|nr:hypothetical protein [Thermodesulfobacteriota bacterium]